MVDRLPPEPVERLIEERPLLSMVDKDRVQCPVEVTPPSNPNGLDGPDAVDHASRSDRDPRGPKQTSEMHEIRHEPTAIKAGAFLL